MSVSLSSLLSTAPPLAAGIAIGASHVCAAVFDVEGKRFAARGIHRYDLPKPLFAGPPTPETESALVSALQAVSVHFRTSFASVHVALPDTVIRSTVFELDELPKPADMRESLLRWRFAKEWQRPENSLDCRGFDLGSAQGKRLFFGQAGDRPWIDCVRQALARAGVVPWSLNAAACYRFNRFHDAIVGADGGLLSLDPDCWNLLMWDGAGRIRRVFTRLRSSTSAGEEMKMIADEAQHVMASYAGPISRFHLAGSEAEMAGLSSLLDQHLERKTVPLHADLGVTRTIAGIREGMVPLALAAALST